MTILQIVAGSVGWAVAHDLAQHNDEFGVTVIASRTPQASERVIGSVER